MGSVMWLCVQRTRLSLTHMMARSGSGLHSSSSSSVSQRPSRDHDAHETSLSLQKPIVASATAVIAKRANVRIIIMLYVMLVGRASGDDVVGCCSCLEEKRFYSDDSIRRRDPPSTDVVDDSFVRVVGITGFVVAFVTSFLTKKVYVYGRWGTTRSKASLASVRYRSMADVVFVR